jgi:hypothetical protein
MEEDTPEKGTSGAEVEEQADVTTFDYFAAGIISNFFVWLWNSVLVYIPLLSILDSYSVTVLSYMVYTIGSVVGCNLLLMKASRNFSKTCLKSALVSWGISIPLLLRFSTEFYIGLIVSLLFCFLMGGLIASYLNIKRL